MVSIQENIFTTKNFVNYSMCLYIAAYIHMRGPGNFHFHQRCSIMKNKHAKIPTHFNMPFTFCCLPDTNKNEMPQRVLR